MGESCKKGSGSSTFDKSAKAGTLDLTRPWILTAGRKPILTLDEVDKVVLNASKIQHGALDQGNVKQL